MSISDTPDGSLVQQECASASAIQNRGISQALEAAALSSILALGIPVLAKDFSQSAVEGPRMLPSM